MPSIVQTAPVVEGTSTSVPVVFSGAITEGNRIVLVVGSAAAMAGVTTPDGYDRDAEGERTTGAGGSVVIFSKVAGAGESQTQTITLTSSLAFWASGEEVAECGVVDKVDAYGSVAASVSAIPAGELLTAATTDAAEYVVAGIRTGGADGSDITWTNSFVATANANSGGAGSKIISAAAAQTTTASWTTARTVAAAIATYRDGATPPATSRAGWGMVL